MTPNRVYRNIPLRVEHQIVRVENGEALHLFLKADRKNLYRLTEYLMREHRENSQEALNIRRESLACEILWHYRIQRCTLRLPKFLQKTFFFRRALRATSVIDCGEKKEDTNRWIWDLFCIFYRNPANWS